MTARPTVLWNLKVQIELEGAWNEAMVCGAVAEAIRMYPRHRSKIYRVDVKADR